MKCKTIILIILSWLTPTLALASGIQVSPAKLEFSAVSEQTETQRLVVANPSGEVQTFQIYAEDYPSAITAEPNDFSLQAGGRRDILVIVNLGKLPKKNISTELAIVASPLANKKSLSVAAGVKVTLTISRAAASAPPQTPPNRAAPAITVLLALAIALGFLIVRKRKASGQ